MGAKLPPGQRAIDSFPRFGVPAYANRLPAKPTRFEFEIGTDKSHCALRMEDFERLPRREIVADFHCVTSWTRRDLHWSGYAFGDFYEALFASRVSVASSYPYVEFKALDGYSTCIRIDDLLTENVLLADRLDGEPLSLDHGAPLRLVTPHLFGYKSVKHVCSVRLCSEYRRSFAERQTRAHPRGRVEREERGCGLPGPVYRLVYRALVPATLWIYRRAEKRRTASG